MNRDLKDILFLVFDVETTDLSSLAGQVVEIGAVKFNLAGTIYEEFSTLINPGTTIPENTIRVHGITNEMVENERGTGEVLWNFLNFVGSGDIIMVAHNAPFDIGFIARDLKKHGLDLPKHKVVDTVSLAKSIFPEAGTYNLQNLVNFLGIATTVRHRALNDVLQERELFLRCIEQGNLKSEQDLYEKVKPLPFESAIDFSVDFPPGFEEIKRAIEDERMVKMEYSGGTKGKSIRTITPRNLLGRNGVLYLSAFCHIDKCNKSFRLDRIERFWVEQ